MFLQGFFRIITNKFSISDQNQIMKMFELKYWINHKIMIPFKIWEIYNFLFKPVNVIRIKTLSRSKWIDRDFIILHGAFQVLVDYIELELFHLFKVKNIDELENALQKRALMFLSKGLYTTKQESSLMLSSEKEVVCLYRWWKEYISKNEDNIKIEDEMLHRLIKIRHTFWT